VGGPGRDTWLHCNTFGEVLVKQLEEKESAAVYGTSVEGIERLPSS